MQGYQDRGTLVTGGKRSPHQRFGTFGNKIFNFDNLQNERDKIIPHSGGQHFSSFVSPENGGYHINKNDKSVKRNLDLPIGSGDHNYCRVPPRPVECEGRLGVQERKGSLRVEAVSTNFQSHLSINKNTLSRPLCFQTVKPSPKVFFMETRSVQSGIRCNATKMATTSTPVCIPAFRFDKSNSKKGEARADKYFDSSCTNMANSVMVPSIVKSVETKSNSSSNEAQSSKRPIRPTPPLVEKSNSPAGCLDNFRKNLLSTGISTQAASLIIAARRSGTNTNYTSAWNKWSGWCCERQIDPFQCDIKWILNYLAGLFEAKYQYSTICFHRSAISAFHYKIDNHSIGEHPDVSALITGVFNSRPPQPKYTFIWDVQNVLDYIKDNWANDSELSDKALTLKVTILLALTSASRTLGLHHLDTKFMGRTKDCVVFTYAKLHKSWRKGQSPPSVTFTAFPTDKVFVWLRR